MKKIQIAPAELASTELKYNHPTQVNKTFAS